MYRCIISKIHREPCLDGKKKHIAPLKLVPDLPLQGLPKKLCFMCARTERTAGFAQKALLHSDLNRQLQWGGPSVLPCSQCPGNAGKPSSHPVRRNLLEVLPNCCALLVVGQLLRELLMGELVCKVQRRSAFQFLPVVDAKRLPLRLFTQPLQDLHVGANGIAPTLCGGE